MAATETCPVCGLEAGGVDGLAAHLVERADASDARHVMWLNRTVTKHRVGAAELASLLRDSGSAAARERVKR